MARMTNVSVVRRARAGMRGDGVPAASSLVPRLRAVNRAHGHCEWARHGRGVRACSGRRGAHGSLARRDDALLAASCMLVSRRPGSTRAGEYSLQTVSEKTPRRKSCRVTSVVLLPWYCTYQYTAYRLDFLLQIEITQIGQNTKNSEKDVLPLGRTYCIS